MAHLITSHRGAEHVESEHAAHWNAGTLGNGCYVLPIGSRMACTMTDSNTLRVLFGVGSVCGYDWEIEGDYEEVDIDNGVPGYNRIDLLVARVETAPAEKVALKVYKGEETTGTPVVPGHVQGDLNDGDTVCEMPICSVRVNGINPQAPEMLTTESHTIEGLNIDIADLAKKLEDYKSQSISGGKLVDKSVTSAKLADGSVTSAKIAAKSVTREKLADALFPLTDIAEVSKQYTVGAGSTVNVLVGDIPVKAGYTYVGMCGFNTGNLACHTSGVSGRYIGIKNTHSSAITATASITFLYIRS